MGTQTERLEKPDAIPSTSSTGLLTEMFEPPKRSGGRVQIEDDGDNDANTEDIQAFRWNSCPVSDTLSVQQTIPR